MKIICLGDSLTYGMGVLRRECWTTLAARETGHTLINRGISGDTTGGMLARLDQEVLRQSPDMVILLGGGNDIVATGSDRVARGNLFAMLHQSLAAGIQPVLGTPVPFDVEAIQADWAGLTDFAAAGRICREYVQWIRTLGRIFGTPVADFYALFESLPGFPGEWYLDGLHPAAPGHKRMAALICSLIAEVTATGLEQTC